MPDDLINEIGQDFALKIGLQVAAGAGVVSTFFASTMVYVVSVNPLFGAASSSVVLGSGAATSTASGAGFLGSSGIAGVGGLAAVGIGAAVAFAVGSLVIAYTANWKREDAK